MSCFFILLLQLLNFSNYHNLSVYAGNNGLTHFSSNIHSKEIYDSLNCKELSYLVFELAYNGYLILNEQKQLNNNRFLTIVDFSKPINEKRFFVIDLKLTQVVYNEPVAHAEKTGMAYAGSFSNEINSEKNSLGFYITGRSFLTKDGYALKLLGLESGYNDNAFARGILLHGTDEITTKKSKGCFVISNRVCLGVVEMIKGGSCFFVYYPDEIYLGKSIFNGGTARFIH
jgi:hypothetical protein